MIESKMVEAVSMSREIHLAEAKRPWRRSQSSSTRPCMVFVIRSCFWLLTRFW